MKKVTTQFTRQPIPLDAMVQMQASKPLGATAKVFIHEKARQIPEYTKSIKYGGKGEDKEGNQIAVNTVGRWLFGVPGFQGHIRIVPKDTNVMIYFPQKSPKIIHDFMALLKKAVEGERQI